MDNGSEKLKLISFADIDTEKLSSGSILQHGENRFTCLYGFKPDEIKAADYGTKKFKACLNPRFNLSGFRSSSCRYSKP
ncbi:hypothetical protein V5J35_000775 [Endozoicomonas sp. NE40]|uniref:PAS domain-containing protein n=1 Tax=Endozoicomonas lisbonensis TaxID=3120522 RepID=A0ABV2SCV0_9GAMM